MNRHHIPLLLIFTSAWLVFVMFNFNDRPTTFAALPLDPDQDKDAVIGQIKELQKQVADLKSKISDLKTPHIVAAGTATIRFGAEQDNKTSTRVKLPKNLVDKLGDNCIVQLTNRYPTRPDYFVPYWRPAADGIDILLADPALVGTGLNTNPKVPFYIDWIVVQK